ncbi:MAG: GGDEF domain-containing protein [Lentimicrobiaceae bacterium]|nr:GGDEF domain-containing protein [Lentimicrobiaceae bacterium]
MSLESNLCKIPLLKLIPNAHIIFFSKEDGSFLKINEGSDFYKTGITIESLYSFYIDLRQHSITGMESYVEFSYSGQKHSYQIIEKELDEVISIILVPSPPPSILIEKLKLEVSYDALTNVYSRKAILEIIEKEREKCLNGLHVTSFLMIDIDHFKKINDTYGHDVGDLVLKNVSSVIKKSLREHDYIGRLGGEEFVVVLPDTSSNGASKVALKILKNVQLSALSLDTISSPISSTVSIGITSIDQFTGCDIEKALKNADIALYAAKTNGRNCYETIIN